MRDGWALCRATGPVEFQNLSGTSGSDPETRKAYAKWVKQALGTGSDAHACCGFSNCDRASSRPGGQQRKFACHMESPDHPHCMFLVLACQGNNSRSPGTRFTLKVGFLVDMKKGFGVGRVMAERPAALLHAQEEEVVKLRSAKEGLERRIEALQAELGALRI